MKTISTTAVAVAAGMLFSMSAALAADLGGNCCADLEERVAELEATTARKGNRKVSLTISGQVNRMIMSYSDGGISQPTGSGGAPSGTPPASTGKGDRSSNTFWGIDNTNSSSRFNLGGRAKIDGTRNAGFNMTIEVNTGARSATVNQQQAEAAGVITTAPGVSANGRDDHSLGMRDANVWIEDTRLGRLTLGRLTMPGPQGTIDLGGIGVIAPGTSLVGNGLAYRNAAGIMTGRTVGNGLDLAADTNKRIDGLRYELPTWQGFQFAAAYGEASSTQLFMPGVTAGAVNSASGDLGNAYAVNLKYANEFNGVRLAAAIGYERLTEDGFISPTGAAGVFGMSGTHFGLSGSLMHVATGLFVQGSWTNLERTTSSTVSTAAPFTKVKGETDFWHVAAGITRNWFGYGNTSLYGEYGDSDNGFGTFIAANHTAAGSNVGGTSFWGLGMVQNVDAAALEIYSGYRKYDSSFAGDKSIDVYGAGMRIKF